MRKPNAKEILDRLMKLGNNYRPPQRQGIHWDAVDLIEQLQAALKESRAELRKARKQIETFQQQAEDAYFCMGEMD